MKKAQTLIRRMEQMLLLALALAVVDYVLSLVAPTYQFPYEGSTVILIVCVGCVSLAVALARKGAPDE